MTLAEMQGELAKHGIRIKTISISHLSELQDEIERRRAGGEFADDFYRERLSDLRFDPPTSLPRAKTIIVAAYPQPMLEVTFNLQGKRHPVRIPPTYLYYPNRVVKALLDEMLQPMGYRTASSVLPLKLLAARSGLGEYGRNNISYVPGLGSFHRLMAFYSDHAALEDCWQPPRILERCRTCRACLDSCPTKAIPNFRFLLLAERCLTFLNEKPGPFPAWVDPSSHNALVGCLRCQLVCPENAHVMNCIEQGEEFPEEEEKFWLKGDALEISKMPASLHRRLQSLDLTEYSPFLPRNLQALLNAGGKLVSRKADTPK